LVLVGVRDTVPELLLEVDDERVVEFEDGDVDRLLLTVLAATSDLDLVL